MTGNFPPVPGGYTARRTYYVIYPSGDQSGAADAAAILAAAAALPASGGTVRLNSTGIWNIQAGQVVITRPGIYIDAEGCFINSVGAGDTFRMYYTGISGGTEPYGGGLIGRPVIDGGGAGGSSAFHAGDIFKLHTDAYAQNFSGAGSKGFWYDNANYWTEQMGGDVFADNCTAAVVFDVTGASTSTASFKGTRLKVGINQVNAANDGIVMQDGGLVYDGALEYTGNFVGSSGPVSSASVRVTGTVPAGHPGAGNPAGIYDCRLDFGLECTPGTGGAGSAPQTLAFGSNANLIKNCYGILDWGGDGASANFTKAARIGNLFPFFGIIKGDSTLQFGAQGNPAGAVWNAAAGLAYGDYTSAATLVNGSDIPPARALLRVTAAANVTGITIDPGSFDGQQVFILNESAFTVTFAAQATSHVAGGAAVSIGPQACKILVFDGADTNLWYPA